MPQDLVETDLYQPIHDYLVGHGYEVRSEVLGCDVTATKGDDLIVIELKRNFTVSLLIQATQRQKIADSVYVAVPVPNQSIHSKRWRGIRHLLRRLELGLILVNTDSPTGRSVQVVFHPLPFGRKKDGRKRRAVLQEMEGRSGDYNKGGSTGKKLVTAYRENAIQIACCLERHGPMTPRQLRDLGTGPKTLSILSNNFYGWFERVARGIYTLTGRGKGAMNDYIELAEVYRSSLEERGTGSEAS